MNKKIGAAALAGVMAMMLSGCLIVSADVKGDFDHDRDYARLLGAEIGWRSPEITIIARSNGCTEKDQFAPHVKRRDDGEVRVGFERVREDRCKAFMPEGKRLTWTFAELGIRDGANVRLMNEIGR